MAYDFTISIQFSHKRTECTLASIRLVPIFYLLHWWRLDKICGSPKISLPRTDPGMFHVIQYGSDESWIGHTCSKRNIANLLISTPKRIVEWGYDDLIFHTKNQDTESNKGFFPLLGIKLSERCSLNAKILAFLGHWCYMETTEKNSWNQDCPGKPQEINIPLWECAWKTKP